MNKFRTYDEAKALIANLNEYVSIIEKYKVKSKREWVIKNYALTNSIPGVIKNSINSKYEIDRNYILDILREKPKDPLQKIVNKAYRAKIRRRKNG